MPANRPTFDGIKKRVHRMKPMKRNPVDHMMIMVRNLGLITIAIASQAKAGHAKPAYSWPCPCPGNNEGLGRAGTYGRLWPAKGY